MATPRAIRNDKRKPTEEERDEIWRAAEDGDLNTLQQLHSNGVDVTGVVSDTRNRTSLHYAALNGHYTVASSLLDWGSEVDSVNVEHYTPLHFAARSGHTDIAALLVGNGADVNMKNKVGRTPLDCAVLGNKGNVVEYFVNRVQMDTTQYDQETQEKIEQILLEEASRIKSIVQQVPHAKMGRAAVSKKVVYAYLQASHKGTRAANQLKLVMMGAEGVGKTSTVHSLLDKEFQRDQESTIGAAVNRCIIDRVLVSKWRQIEMKHHTQELPKLYNTEMKECISEISKNLSDKQIPTSIQQEVPEEVVTRIKEVMGAKKVANDDVRIIILDLGGQEIYYEVHFMFLAPEDVVLMTFDASKGLKQPVVCRQRLNRFKAKVATRGMQTNLEVLETLFLAVYSHCGDSKKGYISNRIPTILMMATHAKGLTEQQKQDIIVEFYKAFEGRPFLDHLPKNRSDAFYFIDNEVRECKIFTSIKEIILKASKATIEKQCPISYLQFESGLLQISESKSIITMQEALDIARKADVEEDKVKELLLHYSYKGVLLFYPDTPSLQDVVFVDPQEISDLVSSVITTHDCQPSSSSLQVACIRYDTYGLLEEALLDDILERSNCLQQKEIILGLLKKFDLAVEVSVDTKFIDEDDSYVSPKSGKVFVVPSMLVYNERMVYQKKPDDVVVLFHYPDKFIFETVFNHVIVKTVRWCNEEGHQVRRIYRGTGYFDFKMRKQSFRLQQCSDTYSIKCYITIHAEDQPMMLTQPKFPIGYVECPLEHTENCFPHVRLDDIYEVEDVPCSKNENQIVPRKAYMALKTMIHVSSKPKCTDVPNVALTQVPTVLELGDIVLPRIAVDWKSVAIDLELKQHTIAVIEQRCRNDPRSCCMQMLSEWVITEQGVSPKTWATLLFIIKQTKKLASACNDIENDLANLPIANITKLKLPQHHPQEVKMKHLNSMVIPKVAAQWRVIADYLEYDPSMIQVIDQRWRDPILCCQDLFRDWLGTNHGVGPKTWTTLLSILKQIRQLIAIAEGIENELAELKSL
ncbi:uncharacterized protein [Dysidea avara]|uniref:uncharacterized protein isoform X2 n=1 Tax=Dysidea avara TaxID=196820 RepID=UPI00332BCB19